MKDIYKELHIKLDRYKLTKIQRAMFYQQIQDVIEQMDEEKINDEFLDDLINDIFAYNDIDKVVKKEQSKIKFNNIFWGILLISLSIMIIFTDVRIITLLLLSLIPLTFYLLARRLFLLALIAFYTIINTLFGIGGGSVIIGLIIAYIGFQILFPSKRSSVKYYKFKQHNEYYNHSQKNTHSNHYNKEFKVEENPENEVMFIDNNFNGTTFSLREQNINYINLQNKFGGVEVDLTSFTFPKGDLVINVNNRFAGTTFYINDQTEVLFSVESKFGGVTGDHPYKYKGEIEHKVYIQGKNSFGGIDVK